jgi:release factor glutamine methyltransferase
LWYVEFFWIKFFVNENTLVPRPETEYMITAVSEYVSSKENNDNVLLDIWTWSWVLACSVLLQNEGKFWDVFMVDISEKALEVARKNYDHLIGEWKYNTRIMVSDLCAFLWEEQNTIDNKDIVLVANLPYIPTKTFEDNAPDNVQKWEPKVAFVWGDDGLDLYRAMFRQLEELTKNVKWLTMFLEMMTWQIDILREKFWEILDFEEVKTFHFNIRIVKAQFKK